MTKSLSAVGAFERLFARVDADVLLQMMLEFESLHALGTFEFSQLVGFVVRNHVTLKTVNVGERFGAHFAHHFLKDSLSERVGSVHGYVFLHFDDVVKTHAALRTRHLPR